MWHGRYRKACARSVLAYFKMIKNSKMIGNSKMNSPTSCIFVNRLLGLWFRPVWISLTRILCMLPLAALGAQEGGFTFEPDGINDGVVITKYDWREGAVTIPDRLGTKVVTSIGYFAFSGFTGLTNVTIPDSVTSIGGWAFSGCTGLTSVTIPNSVTAIGRWAFSGCTGLTSVSIGNGVTDIGDWTFSGCTGLTSVSIGNSVTDIGDGTFSGCTSLTAIEVGALNAAYSSLGGVLFNKLQSFLLLFPPGRSGAYTIPDGVTSIGGGTFYGCTGLTSVSIPNSVTSIGPSAFSGCTGLISVSIGNSVTSIEGYAFSGCTGLTSVTIPNSVTSIGDGTFYGCTALTSVSIPNSVTSIGRWAFSGCTGLTSVTIPNSVTSIGDGTFSGCTALTSVTIPNSVTEIGYSAFSGCTGLTAIEVHALNPAYSSVNGVLFDKLQSVLLIFPPGRSGAYTIPNSVTDIRAGTFSGCTGLTAIEVDALNAAYSSLGGVLFNKLQSVLLVFPPGRSGAYTIPNSVTSIGRWAFSGCTGLTSVTIPNSVTSIGPSAFSGCTGLTSVTIPNSVTSIGPDAFSGCTGLISVSIGNSVTSIEGGTFYGCTALTSVSIPNSVTEIGYQAFSGCTGLTSVTIPNSVTEIEGYAFSGCTGLTSVTIPNSVTSIGGGTFSGCTGLTSVTIPNSVTSIAGYAFSGCTGLTSVYCEGNAPHPSEIEPLFDGSPLVIVYYLPGTAGWASLYSGRPTLVRKPVPLYFDWLQSTTLASRYPEASAPADDPDLDGMSNEAEMLAGTDPTESISRLVLERTPRPDELPEADRTPLQEGEHAFYIRTVPGKRYGVHTADLLGQWRLDRIVTATTSQARLVFSKPAADAFYRVILAE
jgi:hypothetical protein